MPLIWEILHNVLTQVFENQRVFNRNALKTFLLEIKKKQQALHCDSVIFKVLSYQRFSKLYCQNYYGASQSGSSII